MEVDFWGVKSSGCENSHATEVKCSNIRKAISIPKKKRNERQSRRKSKKFQLLVLISQQKRFFGQSSFIIQMSLRVFRATFPMEKKAAKL
jgi:hypothetical protein